MLFQLLIWFLVAAEDPHVRKKSYSGKIKYFCCIETKIKYSEQEFKGFMLTLC